MRLVWGAVGRLSAILPVVVLCSIGAPTAAPQTTKLRVSLPISIDSAIGQNIREFARQVETRTGGTVTFELQVNNRFYDELGVVWGVATAGIEIGATSLNQFAHYVPLAEAFLQPFLFNFDALVQAATSRESKIRALIEKEILLKTNARVLWWQPYGSSVILSRSILATNPAAIAARFVGVPDDQVRDLMRVCGASLIPVSPASINAQLQSGAILAAAADITNVAEHELWRVADTIINLRHAPSLFTVVINEKAWLALAPAEQQILSEAAEDAQAVMWARFVTIRAAAFAAAVQKGMRIVEPSGDDIAQWRACSAALLEAYMVRAGQAGPKLFEAYGKLRTEPCCRDAPSGEEHFSNR
jgi:C4-dicarboxylate-binding protein DctP